MAESAYRIVQEGNEMSKYTADVLFHIDENLDERDVTRLEHDMAFHQGVRTACVNCENPHLMVVDYDPMEVKAKQLLGSITSRGLHAELVGF
jgi:hypothetical protein